MEDYKKKYEEALDNFKKIKAANKDNKELVDFIEYEYPELKESEDENIRKELIEFVKSRGGFKQEYIAWLEKQDPKKHEEELEKAYKCADEVQYRKGYEDAKREIENQNKQKPAWSEEDERIFTLCALSVKTRYNDGLLTHHEYELETLWLESIKERMKGE